MRALVVLAVVVVAVVGGLAVAVLYTEGLGEPVIVLAEGKTRPQGGFYVGCYAEPRELNPFTTNDQIVRRVVLRFVCDTLMEWDPDTGDLRPALAESVKRSADGRTCVFTMRQGVRFSNGTPLTMADVTFTYELGKQTKVALGRISEALAKIEQLRPLDDRRLEMVLQDGSPDTYRIVASGYQVVRKRHFLGRRLDTVQFPGPGTGPYQVARDADGRPLWRRGRDLLLVQNPYSWRHRAFPDRWNLAGMRLLFVADQAARFNLLKQGQLDVFVDPDIHKLLADNPDLKQSYRPVVYDQLWSGNLVLLWNHRRPYLADPRVRRALTMLFDRKAIVEKLMARQGRATATWFRPGSPEAEGAPEPLPFDPAGAARLLAETGLAGDRPFELPITIAAGQRLHRRMMELAQPAFAQTSVKLRVEAVPASTMFVKLKEGDFHGMLLFIGLGPIADPVHLFRRREVRDHNLMGWDKPAAHDLLERATRTINPAARLELYHRFNEVFHVEQPLTLLAYRLAGVLLHKRFQDTEPNKLGLYPERWWVRPDGRRN
ncbi:MAG: ABC transporter substrate-binding protein [Planctomycetota bacterium]|jgi:peptide/nickel transport system substrate-binding protein